MKPLLILMVFGLVGQLFFMEDGCKEAPLFRMDAPQEGRSAGTPQDGQLVDLVDSVSEGRGEVVTGEPALSRYDRTQDENETETPDDKTGAVALKFDY